MASIWDHVEIIGLDDKPEVKKAVEDKVEEVARDLPDPKARNEKMTKADLGAERAWILLGGIVRAHEAKHGPGLPTSKAPGWQAARELLVAINKARHELGGDA